MTSIEIIKEEKIEQFLLKIKERSQFDSGGHETKVKEILKNIKSKGDEALFDYTHQFDKVMLTKDTIRVTPEEIEAAYLEVDQELIEVIKKAARRITSYHQKQKQTSWMDVDGEGTVLGQLVLPMESCGVYVPGGKASYPSSVLMNVLPAKVAGVKNIVMVTPPSINGTINPVVLVAAHIAGVTEIYKVGGAQAIGALAYGTCCIPKVDKIVGPGNIYVALAKKEVFGYVSIDSIAGPSEILIIADESCTPRFVAADCLSQAEHDELASSIVVTTSYDVALKIKAEVELQLSNLSRKAITQTSIDNYGGILVVNSLEEAIEVSNRIAPEHLELCVSDPWNVMTKIRHAGAIFLGHYTPEPIGDYMAGPNHVLPTSGTARFFSVLSVDDFIRKPSILSFSKDSLQQYAEDVILFAESEQLTAHANSMRVRYE